MPPLGMYAITAPCGAVPGATVDSGPLPTGRIHYKTAYAPPATRGLRYETVINLVVGFEVARSFPKSLKIAASTLFVR